MRNPCQLADDSMTILASVNLTVLHILIVEINNNKNNNKQKRADNKKNRK